MKKQLLFVIFFLCLIFTQCLAALPVDGYDISEWKDILKVPQDHDTMFGMSLMSNISPDLYYPDGPVNISGELTSVFGPASSMIFLIKKNSTGKHMISSAETDEEGKVCFSILPEYNEKTQYFLKLSTNESKEIVTGSIYEMMESINPGTFGEKIEINAINLSNIPVSDTKISLTSSDSEYRPGDIINLTGRLTFGEKPLPLRDVRFMMNGTDPNLFSKITATTDEKGLFNRSLHLPDAGSFELYAYYEDSKTYVKVYSDPVELKENLSLYAPPAKVIPDKRTLSIKTDNRTLSPDEDMTIYGWFSDSYGLPVNGEMPGFFVYNAEDGIWDRYKGTSDAVTGFNGDFIYNAKAPSVPGTYFFSAINRIDLSARPLFSNLMIINVLDTFKEEIISEDMTYLNITSNPEIGTVNTTEYITFTLTDYLGYPMSGQNLTLQYSNDGITWYTSGNNVITDTSGKFVLDIIPEKSGYLYYQAYYAGDESNSEVVSEIFVIPVTDRKN